MVIQNLNQDRHKFQDNAGSRMIVEAQVYSCMLISILFSELSCVEADRSNIVYNNKSQWHMCNLGFSRAKKCDEGKAKQRTVSKEGYLFCLLS